MNLASDVRHKVTALWHVQRVRRLIREAAQLPPPTLVSVTEIPCTDPSCPGPATQITILGPDLVRRVSVIHRPVAEVTAADLGRIGT